jgi:ubiquinone biosynthesis protein COQ4
MMFAIKTASQGLFRTSSRLSQAIPSNPTQCTRSLASSNRKIPFYGAPRRLPLVPDTSSTSSPWSSSIVLQRIAVAIQSATTALQDPTRADAVAALGEVTGHYALTSMHQTMMADETGRRILKDRPIVSKETLMPVLNMSVGHLDDNDDTITFGQGYARFLQGHGFDPDERDQVRHIPDADLAYTMLRYRQCHDFWHVLTGLPPTVLGELGLKWLELLQTGLPVAALSATVGSLRLGDKERVTLNQHYLPWAIQMSRQSTYLLNVYYEKEFDTNLNELRRRLKIVPAPIVS